MIDTLLETLSHKQREVLQQMLGPELKPTKAHLDLMLAQLRRWSWSTSPEVASTKG